MSCTDTNFLSPLQDCGAFERLVSIYEDESNAELVRRGAAEAMRQCKFAYLPHKVLPGRDLSQAEAAAGPELKA